MRVKWNTYGQYTIWIQNALILLVRKHKSRPEKTIDFLARDTLTVQSFCVTRTSLRFEWWGFFLNVIHDVLNQQSVHGI
jgi:hypothetical protein